MAEKPHTTDTFTIAPSLVFSLSGGGIKRNGWEVRKNGSTVNETQGKAYQWCKGWIKRQFPTGTRLSWTKRDEVTWEAKVDA